MMLGICQREGEMQQTWLVMVVAFFAPFSQIGAMVLLISFKQIKHESWACAQIKALEGGNWWSYLDDAGDALEREEDMANLISDGGGFFCPFFSNWCHGSANTNPHIGMWVCTLQHYTTSQQPVHFSISWGDQGKTRIFTSIMGKNTHHCNGWWTPVVLHSGSIGGKTIRRTATVTIKSRFGRSGGGKWPLGVAKVLIHNPIGTQI